jgi:putative thioredoxin
MSDFMSRASLAGAVDLSSLRKPEPACGGGSQSGGSQGAGSQGAGSQGAGAHTGAPQGSGVNPGGVASVGELLTLPSLIAQGNETNLRNFIDVSNQLPVIIEFYAGWSEQSKSLTPKMVKLTQALAGRILLLQFDLDSNINVAKAFKVGSAPTVLALLRGQPVPLFEGDQPETNIQVVFDRVLEIAAENGMNGVITVEEPSGVEAQPALPPRHQAAFDAIDAGNYAEAISQYEQAINESPADTLAISGLAQAKLLLRTEGIEFEKVLASAPVTLDEVLLKADACIAVGHPAEAFSTILTRFASVFGDEREALRKHLLELFLICPPDLPEMAEARRKLAALLY